MTPSAHGAGVGARHPLEGVVAELLSKRRTRVTVVARAMEDFPDESNAQVESRIRGVLELVRDSDFFGPWSFVDRKFGRLVADQYATVCSSGLLWYVKLYVVEPPKAPTKLTVLASCHLAEYGVTMPDGSCRRKG